MSFEALKKEVFGFESFDKIATQEYDERIGIPDQLSSCIGLISISFQRLENTVSICIGKILSVDNDLSSILTAELSFKNKVNLLASLLQKFKNEQRFNFYPGHEDEYIIELIKAVSKCEELRNKIMHSTFVTSPVDKKLIRHKKTSRAKRGLVIINEEIKIPNLLNIYDFITSMDLELDGLII